MLAVLGGLVVTANASAPYRIAAAAGFALSPVCALFTWLLLQVPYKQRDEARDVLQRERDEQRRLAEPGARAERLRQLQSGDVAPRDEQELSIVLEDWCGSLTEKLHKYRCERPGTPEHPPQPDDAAVAMEEFYSGLRQRGVRILDRGMVLGLVTRGTRAKLYAPRSPDELWALQDEIWDKHVAAWEKAR